MLKSSSEHLADIAAGSPPAAATSNDDGIEENVNSADHANNNEPEPLDPAYIQSLQLLAEKKVREAEEKAKRDEEAEWFAAAAEESSKNNNTSATADDRGNNNNNNRTPTTEDILQSIEESVDYNNQTSGFVSSFALPLTPIVPDHDDSDHEQVVDNYDDSDDSESHDVNESLFTQHHHGTGDNDSEKKIITRQQGASSPASIFRTASSSSSTSPKNNIGVSSPSSPYDDSVASDSTEFTRNNTNSFTTPYKLPQHQIQHSHDTETTETIVREVVSPLASPMVTIDKKQMSKNPDVNKQQHHGGRMTKQKPKQEIPRQRPKSKSNNTPSTSTSWTKRKNNLVISPIPITKKQLKQPPQQSKAGPTTTTKKTNTKPTVTIIDSPPIQLSNKPPTHPSTKPPSNSPSSQPILRTHSTQSDADVSIDLSEATPITTPAKSSWFRTYSSDDETEDEDEEGVSSGLKKENYWGSSGVSVDDDEEEDIDDSFTKDNLAHDVAMHQQTGKINQSSTDLVGLEIFEFDPSAQHDDITPKNNNLTIANNRNNNSSSSNDNEIVQEKKIDNALNSSTEYTVSSLFNPTSNRQYKNENLFFNGIYQSGLQSSSFEQVDNTHEDMMCMDAEIELVYNSSGAEQPSFLVDGGDTTDTSFESSVVVADDLDECASVEERREVVRRIQQWRRGRARESAGSARDDSANDNGGKEVEENEENDFNYDYEDEEDDDAIEMAPLTPAKSDNNDTNDYYNGSSASKDPRRRMTGPASFFGNLLWNSQPSRDEYSLSRRKKPRYDDIDFDRNTDKCFNCFARWKKLMIITVMFLLSGSLLSGDGLEKHHMDDNYDVYGENDPLAKSNFIEHGHVPDDTDDYDGVLSYHSSGVPTHLMQHDAEIIKHYQQTPNPGVVADDIWFHFEMGDDEFDTPSFGDLEWETNDEFDDETAARPIIEQPHLIKAEQYNALVGIDRIVVIGDQQSGLDWFVDKLKRLYPDLVIKNGFQSSAGNSGRTLRGSTSQAHRITKVIDPLSDEVIGKEDDTADSKKNTLVIALFLNPYDWAALMHASQHTNGVSWKDYLSTEWLSYANILEYRASMINSAIIDSMRREDVKLVIPLKYEKLLDSFNNADNYVSSSGTATPELPGIVGVIDDIQSRTGLRADETAGWKEPRDHNQFWADPIGCNGHVCHPKIQKLREDVEYISYINEHVDWKAEHLLGYQEKMIPKLDIEQIVVLGERHSGAEWLVDRLRRCFPDVNVKYGFDLRPGKFFQAEPTEAQPNTLVVSVFVNPYDWVDMMRRNPINAPTHKDLEWTDFVTTRWERKRSNMDENLEDTASAVCSFGFAFDEVIPCQTQRDPNTDSFPLYELRPDGTAYANLLELREDKIKNFLSTANFDGVVDHIEIRYEDLVWDDDYTDDALYLTLPFPGIAGLLEKIRDQTKLVPDISAGWILDEDGVFRAEQLGVGVAKLDPYFVQWMEDNIDWEVEDLINYSP